MGLDGPALGTRETAARRRRRPGEVWAGETMAMAAAGGGEEGGPRGAVGSDRSSVAAELRRDHTMPEAGRWGLGGGGAWLKKVAGGLLWHSVYNNPVKT